MTVNTGLSLRGDATPHRLRGANHLGRRWTDDVRALAPVYRYHDNALTGSALGRAVVRRAAPVLLSREESGGVRAAEAPR